MVCLVQTVHLSCVMISTIFKRTKTSFYLSLITLGYLQVHLKWFLIRWYVRRKPYTCLTSRLALSPNAPKQDSTRPMSPSRSIVCVQNDFRASGMFDTKTAPILHQHKHCLQMEWNEIPHEPRDVGVSSGARKMISEPIVCSAQTVHLSCVKFSNISKWTETSFHLSLVT
jgi:hypothetical protein